MVNSKPNLDRVFGALADPTRRAILTRLNRGEATVGELAEPFDMSMPAITKHLNVLQQAGLIHRRRDGRMKRCSLNPEGVEAARAWLADYLVESDAARRP
ncbi:ArsR/SmtB family transcription factor [Minwuia thermotolerans]|uniref:Transcriptional regulator n=1 Tax=Minwuia thermotolerans TaxID=2056226 RepID=A0A2M9FZ81_9PROT|nr:metalloregulator ArsR/SmtB family transcription factor [Minwuia thermotolerans]PJK28734.1 transcriptional regulator [Minwuia thermotolerans]